MNNKYPPPTLEKKNSLPTITATHLDNSLPAITATHLDNRHQAGFDSGVVAGKPLPHPLQDGFLTLGVARAAVHQMKRREQGRQGLGVGKT